MNPNNKLTNRPNIITGISVIVLITSFLYLVHLIGVLIVESEMLSLVSNKNGGILKADLFRAADFNPRKSDAR